MRQKEGTNWNHKDSHHSEPLTLRTRCSPGEAGTLCYGAAYAPGPGLREADGGDGVRAWGLGAAPRQQGEPAEERQRA